MPTQAERFAKCVKKLTKRFRPASLKQRKSSFTASDKEGIAIAICTKTILWPQGRTLKRFSMENGKPVLITQKRKTVRRSSRSKK